MSSCTASRAHAFAKLASPLSPSKYLPISACRFAVVIDLSPACPVRRAMEMLGGKWTLLIIHALGDERLRFAELRRRVPGISDKMLTQELRALAGHGLVRRHDHGEVPPRVDYVLTARGRGGLAVVEALATFGLGADAVEDASA